MPNLPLDFQFNQANLQDYQTCPRRFKLRYLEQLRWPAIESSPVHETERLAKLGTDFHHLVRQHLDCQRLGFDMVEVETRLSAMAVAHDLQQWWESYLHFRPAILNESQIYPEITFSTPLQGYRLVARFDALAVTPQGQVTIIDWKTALRKPRQEALAKRWQTRVYPYVLAQAGAALLPTAEARIDPADIRMVYWYPAEVDNHETTFLYNHTLFAETEMQLSHLIEQIKSAAEQADFPLANSVYPCQYCVYRSLCNRGDKAGDLVDEDADLAEESLDVAALDWEQIAEIQF